MDQQYFEETASVIKTSKINFSSHIGIITKSERLSQVELIWSVKSTCKDDPDSDTVRVHSDVSIFFENPDIINLNNFEVLVEQEVPKHSGRRYREIIRNQIAIKGAQIIFSFREKVLARKNHLEFEVKYKLTISLKRKSLKQTFDFDSLTLDKPKHLPIPSLYGNDMFSDFTFILQHSLGEREIKVHQSVLFLASEVFNNIFNGDFIDSTSEFEATITDIDPDAFEVMLKFLYGVQQHFESIFNPNSSMVLLVYQAADKYEIFDLMKICLYHITKSYVTLQNEDGSLNIGNLYETYQFAMQYGLQTLKQYCEEIFRYDVLNDLKLVSPELLIETFEKAAHAEDV